MTEIWLNYGMTKVVLDIRAENMGQRIDLAGDTLEDNKINELLGGLDMKRPVELIVLHDSQSVRKVISSLFLICEKSSLPFPKILSDKRVMGQIRPGLPEGSTIEEFTNTDMSSDLVFVGEVEFDGLFGYETISTRLFKRFGQESMLSAYARRKSNMPVPGQATDSFGDATKFIDGFEIRAIELASNSSGIVDLAVGHPSKTSSMTKALESFAVREAEKQKSMMISTGKSASNESLSKSLSSLWNCMPAMKKDGLAILIAECQNGLGSDALQLYIEGRLAPAQLKNPTRYVEGMENLLYLDGMREYFQVGIVSILPEFYAKKLNMIPLYGVKESMDYILKTQGSGQKVTVVSDGARILLR